jgi:hypothetical protein
MASAAITLAENPATIESDTSEVVITNASGLRGGKTFQGELRNHGPADVYCKVSVTPGTPAATVATTGAQAQLQIPLPAGSSIPILFHYFTIAHKTASGTAVLSWVPDKGRM